MSKTFFASLLSLAAVSMLAAPALATPGDFALEQQIRRNMGFAPGISVEADNGRVILSGQTETQRDRDAVIAAAKSVQGVGSVKADIDIVSGS